MDEQISDLDMILTWNRTCTELKVHTLEGSLMYSSISKFVNPKLSARQVQWVTGEYERKRKNYVFA